jgi:thiol-disulfide isomerase/thioredoxin
MKQAKIFFTIVGLLILGGIFTFLIQRDHKDIPGKYDTFAQCLKTNGATFYGAFWCPHCKAQKALFGTSVDLLPYIECSLPDASGQTQICKDKKIEGYPTWEFPDGSILTGEQTFEKLAEKTSCVLPK